MFRRVKVIGRLNYEWHIFEIKDTNDQEICSQHIIVELLANLFTQTITINNDYQIINNIQFDNEAIENF